VNRHVRTFSVVLVLLLSVGLIVVIATAAVVGADNTRVIRQTQRDNAELLTLIRSCTTPGQKCFNESQKRTADVVADLNRVAVYAASCADKRGVQGEDEIYACVIKLLAKADASP
jgi:predicted PurR-regulated permease PerM